MNLTTRKVAEAFGYYPEPLMDMDEPGIVAVCCLACRNETARYGIATPVIYGDVSLDCGSCGSQIVRWRAF